MGKPEIIGDNLTQIRAHLRLTQKQVCNHLGLSSTHQLIALETGTGKVQLHVLLAVCEAYGITPEDAMKENYWQHYIKKVPKGPGEVKRHFKHE